MYDVTVVITIPDSLAGSQIHAEKIIESFFDEEGDIDWKVRIQPKKERD